MARTIVATHRGHLVSRVDDACAHVANLSSPMSPAYAPTFGWEGNGNLGSQEKQEQRVAVT